MQSLGLFNLPHEDISVDKQIQTCSSSLLKSETVLDSINSTFNDSIGSLSFTCLRLCFNNILSVGFNTISNVILTDSTLKIKADLLSESQSFFFTSTNNNEISIFTRKLKHILNSYSKSKSYREILIRSPKVIITDLLLLNNEDILETIMGVCNVAADQGNFGIFVITNLRIVWYATHDPLFNVSVPYLQFVFLINID